ncbi:MAG TPA: alkaline phosphatase family protein [Candidatus Acidoferrales bacterium]|nr:alkaline phosphatase family protein [Candidatus Acidoferrales bacterium]
MSLDDLVLFLQHAIDRFVRRLRRGAPPAVTGRKFLIVQIDGLSRAVLEQALAAGYMRFLKRLLRSQQYRLEPMAVGLPTSTPAFQMAAMYGVRPDIPGFHYYDRERQADIHFPRAGHAAIVEKKLAAGRRGILEGGSAYGCVFTGGAANSLFTFASLTRPSGRGLLAALSPFVVLAWVCVKSLTRTIGEVVKSIRWFARYPRGRRQGWRWFTIKVGCSVWIREFFTLSVARDLYAGVPAVYVNYVDYDEAAHNFGPRSRAALVTLRRVDRAIRRLWRVTQRVPEHQYDLYILADHGQAPCKAYQDITGGKRFERWIFERFLDASATTAADASPRSGLVHGIRASRKGAKNFFQHFLNYIDEDFLRREDPEAYQQNDIRVIAAGPNAFLYVLGTVAPLDVEALERRFPGLAEKLSESPGVGFVLARSSNGPVCFYQGKRYQLQECGPGPFARREDAGLVLQGILDLMEMPSAGDLVIYGIDAPQGHVSFIPEMGAHAGPSPDELHTFIVRPSSVSLPLPINHPVQLYEHFIRYHELAAPS